MARRRGFKEDPSGIAVQPLDYPVETVLAHDDVLYLVQRVASRARLSARSVSELARLAP